MGKKITIQHIADYLGVSKYVVSRALAGKSGVKEETRIKVLETAKQLGYNNNGQLFSSNQTITEHQLKISQQNVLVVLPKSQYQNSMYWGKIIDGISSELSEFSLGMVIVTESDRFSTVFNSEVFLGIICVGKLSTSVLLEFKTWKVPVVLIDYEEPLFNADTIFANNYDSSYKLTSYLIGLGHRHIKFVGNSYFSRSFYDRWLGYRSALEYHGLSINQNSKLLNEGEDLTAMCENIKDWLISEVQTIEKSPTALVCANDTIALFVLDILKELEVKIPEQISVTGYDNIDNSYLQSPTLTTIHVPKEQMGKRSVRSLIDQMSREKENAEKILLSCELILRESTGRAR
ncbi:LacI family transcriptional regulator [Metabacillus crassostreae]|uniref:LacI family DNA-binding transcriptional regulator n=1 Tax=Metabacillus crassostreae TaxID=929098 RepID=UPI00195848B4|nr:LacI family DNA-binding transcriptional regulator [Metabacillus crassostreae]MBM7602221.1 LacI family transcriptional regulator [Metabacillus crassostreae]